MRGINNQLQRPLMIAIAARALVTTSDITPGILESPLGLSRMVFSVLVGWQQIGILPLGFKLTPRETRVKYKMTSFIVVRFLLDQISS